MTHPAYTCRDCGHDRGTHNSTGCAFSGGCPCQVTFMTLYMRGVAEGQAAGEAGRALVDEAMDREADTWPDEAIAWVDTLPAGALFSADDVTDAIGMPARPMGVGSTMRRMANAETIRSTGRFVRSSRPLRHSGLITLWEKA